MCFCFLHVFTNFHQNPTDMWSQLAVMQLCIMKQHSWLSSLNLLVHPLFPNFILKNLIYFLLAILCVIYHLSVCLSI